MDSRPRVAMSLRAVLLSAIVAAMCVPAVASAELSDWTHDGNPLEETAEEVLLGGFAYTGGTNCWDEVEAVLSLEPGSTGTVTSFSVAAVECEVTGTIKATGCTQVSNVTPESLPWTVHNTASSLVITDFTITVDYEGGPFCFPFYPIEGTLALAPDAESEGFELFRLDSDLKLFGSQEIILEGAFAGTNQATYGL